jgi:hypothetical protein
MRRSARPRKSRVFTRHGGPAGDVWSADLAGAATAGASRRLMMLDTGLVAIGSRKLKGPGFARGADDCSRSSCVTYTRESAVIGI